MIITLTTLNELVGHKSAPMLFRVTDTNHNVTTSDQTCSCWVNGCSDVLNMRAVTTRNDTEGTAE